MAFYSISFPLNFPDTYARQALNTVLTRIRHKLNKFSYIWVAERQKKGTLHFHLLTNRYINVRIVNYWFAAAIQSLRIKYRINCGAFTPDTFNGVDVRRVITQKGIRSYITKYITKNNTSIRGSAWRCSRCVSALCTAITVFRTSFDHWSSELVQLSELLIGRSGINEDITITFCGYARGAPSYLMRDLDSINNYIYNLFD